MADLLLWIGLILIIIALLALFVNFIWAFLIFLLSCVVFTLWSKTSAGKTAIEESEVKAKAKKEKREADARRAKLAAAQLVNQLEQNLQQLSNDPTNAQALDDVLSILPNLDKDQLREVVGSVILPLLSLKPLDARVRAAVFVCAQKLSSRISLSNAVPSKLFYDAALDILQQHPEHSVLKQYVLEVGRWHYSMTRPDGKVTTYDEQSIQNDIFVRVK
ncbi:hypothetical protein [Alkalinema sp. FACHB-956]|uniref:hypothetical protein n=1 Tax=Alkalinema sp. FACHB-956 TaxID=2692768 RepID=UPI001685938F|nr:hypothetical protein [Alkalinema sp. FACHB-956]MBD2326904.1 hypothetical protein [Alkalinema sp. FACHB-956]